MNISFYILLLFVVSTYAGKLQPKPLGLKETKRYVDEYSAIDASGIQSSSSLDFTTQSKTKVVPLPIPSFIRKTRSLRSPYLRTLVFRRENEICFSKYPKLVCKQGETATKTESKDIDLVCFGKNQHPLYEKLIREVESRVITELASLDRTETYTYNSPTECSKS